jgi:hypothetical protein
MVQRGMFQEVLNLSLESVKMEEGSHMLKNMATSGIRNNFQFVANNQMSTLALLPQGTEWC